MDNIKEFLVFFSYADQPRRINLQISVFKREKDNATSLATDAQMQE